ncbi:dehydratase [Ktedonobacter sp. SOSP1-85]|uniref:FAS1-like dehydratase domain-containing protein n=1 Tax=Ktedonobacter sp. SOSP1-85 TaxID=2778367 RepID=UPI001914EE73|nr:MaoC family dehydratase N-terminal domain-containing protein [Ktedonobacter sp. SOSP1-85]GHO77137.1 dehydratase [Ktedonobacter sp. SOSP1-85]
MFDTSKIGHRFAPFTTEVHRQKIHELTTAIGDDNPVYHSREAAQAQGFPDVPISPTTPTMFSFWGARQRGNDLGSLGINVKGILHGEEEYEYLAPIYPGETLTGVTTVVDGKTRQGRDGLSMDIITTETEYTNQQQQPVLKTRSTIVIREQPSPVSKEANT